MDSAGGSERVITNITNRINDLTEHKIYVLSLFGKSSYFNLNKNIEFCILSDRNISIYKIGALLIRKINYIKPDTIVGFSIQKLNIFLAFCSLFFNKKINMIASEHISFSSTDKFINFLKKIIYKRFDFITVLTQNDKDLMERGGYKNIILLRNASSFFPDIASLQPFHKREKIILAVGRLEFQKGFDLLISCWSMIYVKFPEWKLYIIGEGSLEEKLQELKKQKLSLLNNCSILPFTNSLQDYFNNAQLFILSSRFEGFPMVMIEAMSYGIPSIAFDCETGPREIVNVNNGILIENGNIALMARNLEILLNDYDMRNNLSNGCINDRNNYKLDNIVNQWLQILIN
jgi:amylovoran biosynthesis glycosyltransferase AmsD